MNWEEISRTIKANRRRGYIVSLAYIFCLLMLLIITGGPIVNRPSYMSLSAEEMSAKYPVYEWNPPYITIKEPKIEEVFRGADAVIVGVVKEVLPEYSVNLIYDSNTPEGQIYEKSKGDGVRTSASFLQYRVHVIGDITEKMFKNDELTVQDIIIAVSSELKGYVPEPEPDMVIVTPVTKGKGSHEGRYFFSKYGFYYVTEDGYVLPAYVEDEEYKFAGRKLSYLKKKVKEIISEK